MSGLRIVPGATSRTTPLAAGAEAARARTSSIEHRLEGARPEQLHLFGTDRELGRSEAELRGQDVRVARIEDRCLDRTTEDRFRMVHEIGVERIVTGDEHDQRTLAGPPGPPGLLPQ